MNIKKFFALALLLGAAYAFSGCSREKSSEKDILEFWVDGVQYEKSGANFAKFYPKLSQDHWDRWPAMPAAPSKVVVSPRASISPPATERRDFEQGVVYTVTAEDGTTATFTVKANRDEYLD